jgi:hypothetical protein
MRTILMTFALLGILLLQGCTNIYRNNDDFVQTELYFGQSSVNREITPKQWQNFVDKSIAINFKEGFTIFDAYGQWMYEPNKISREKMKIVLILHKNNSQTDIKIKQVIKEYKKQFDQLSVLCVTTPVKYSF